MVDARIIEMLSKLRPKDDPLSSLEIADILWLATQRRRRQQLTETITPEPPSKAPPKDSGKAPEDSQPDPKPLNLEPENDPKPDPPLEVPVVPSTPAPQPAPAKALPFAVPAARALPQARFIARALRPLRQKVNSRTQQVIDIPATIYRLAEEKILIPELKPAQESWFDVVLVVEKTSAYGIWAPTINEFEQLLLHQGGLRDARRWYAEPQADGTLRLHSRQGKTRAVKELIQSGSQRLIFIFSDCVDPTWRNGAWQKWCEIWGQHHAVVVMQLLPTAFWRRTQLHHLSKAWQRSDRVNPLNRQWQFSDYSGLDDDFETPQGFPAPVLPLEPYPLSIWAQGMLGRSPVDLTGYFLNSVPIAPTTSDAPPPTAQTRFNNFCKMASAPAQRLAALMSAVPVQLPIARLIQQTILKAEANPTQIAEIFLSGIVQRRGNADDPNKQLYDFYADDQADIRALLNQTLPAREIAAVIDCLSADLARRAGKSIQEFQALLMAPAPAGVDSELAAEIGEFARVTLAVLKGLGGDYKAFAEALEGGEPDSEDEPQEIELIPYDYEAVSLKVSSWETGTFTFVVGKLVKKRNGWQVDQEEGQAPGLTQWLTEEVKLELMAIPAGNFVMGAPKTEKESRDNERPQQLITLKSFYLGRFPVTQGQWRVVAGWEPVERALEAEPSNFKEDFEVDSDDRWQRPVEQVSWFEAVEFCARLSRETGLIYRLPTEAEWEYACRGIKREQLLAMAGESPTVGERSRTVEKWLTGESALSERERAEVITQWNQHYAQPFHFGPTLTDKVANYDATYTYNNGPKGEYREQTTPVGYFERSNPFGLSDLHGNVWEWCLNEYHSSLAEMSADDQSRQPLEQDNSSIKVLRGGSWFYDPGYCRSAYRSYVNPGLRDLFIGFRVLCESPRT